MGDIAPCRLAWRPMGCQGWRPAPPETPAPPNAATARHRDGGPKCAHRRRNRPGQCQSLPHCRNPHGDRPRESVAALFYVDEVECQRAAVGACLLVVILLATTPDELSLTQQLGLECQHVLQALVGEAARQCAFGDAREKLKAHGREVERHGIASALGERHVQQRALVFASSLMAMPTPLTRRDGPPCRTAR